MIPEEIRPAHRRRERAQARLAGYIRNGNWYVTLLARESACTVNAEHDNPPFVQYTWRDDLRLQLETQGDHYRDEPYNETQIRMLEALGYCAPFTLGDDLCNRTILREGEGCHPESAAKLMIETLWLLHGVHFHDPTMSARHGLSYWTFEWRVNPTTLDIEAALRERHARN
jgi:hypothetical protein